MTGTKKYVIASVLALSLSTTVYATADVGETVEALIREPKNGGNITAPPLITGINKTEAQVSGRVAITGSGFGASGEVVIAGLGAWVSTWSDTRVVAYVPEAAALGPATVRVVSQGLQSNPVSLTVTDRQADGRVRWRFETEGVNQWWRPALAPDGTIYLHTNASEGLVYAISPDGALLWIQKVNAYPYVPPSAGPDGAVYVGSIGTIYRISADGNIDWQYNPPDGVNIKVSPTIGPGGLLYGAFEVSGVFAMDPVSGTVLWSNPGDPVMTDKAGDAVEMKFGPSGPGQPVDRVYTSMEGLAGGLWAFSTTGEQLWVTSLSNVSGTAEAAIGSDGTIYGPRGLGLTVVGLDPSDGSTLWQYYPGPSDWAVGTDNVEIGPDDILYFVGSTAKLEAFDPHSQSRRWQFFNPDYTLERPSVTPDGSTLVLAGRNTSVYGYPGFVKGFASRNGRELWTVDLPFQLDPGFRVMGRHHPRITPDGATAYVSTVTLAEWPLNQDEHAFLYAIDITSKGGGKGGKTSVGGTPRVYELGQNSPNPFMDRTTIWYELPVSGRVTLSIYDVAGRLVRTLRNGESPAGYHTVEWDQRDHDGRRMPVGIYFYRLSTPDFVATKKMLLLR